MIRNSHRFGSRLLLIAGFAGTAFGCCAMDEARDAVGLAGAQIDEVSSRIDALIRRFPDAATYDPSPIL